MQAAQRGGNVRILHHLADTGGRYAVISMCLGSGMMTLIERE